MEKSNLTHLLSIPSIHNQTEAKEILNQYKKIYSI